MTIDELLLQEQLASSFRDYEVAREQVDQYRRDILPDAKRSLELIETGYRQGEFGYLQLLTAQQTYSRTNLAYVDRLRELRLRAVEIQGMLRSTIRATSVVFRSAKERPFAERKATM